MPNNPSGEWMEKVKKIPQIGHAIFCTSPQLAEDIAQALSSAASEAREKGIEESAKLAESWEQDDDTTGQDIADAIRSLKQKGEI